MGQLARHLGPLLFKLLKPGGVMVLHDTAGAGDVKRVFDELLFS